MNISANIITLMKGMIKITDYIYLYELIDDYKNTELTHEKEAIFYTFCSQIWSCANKRRVYTKTIKYSVNSELLNTDTGKVFDTWSEIEYTGFKSTTKDTGWQSLIRQKINNIYTIYFDKEVVIKKDYMQLLNTPKRLYYQWAGGVSMTPEYVSSAIDDAIYNAGQLKITYQKQKMDLSWEEYMKVIEGMLKKAFNNCRMSCELESSSDFYNIYDFISEDNLYIRYLCRYLDYEIRQWQKQYYNIRSHKQYKRCIVCQALIEVTGKNTRYCPQCRRNARLQSKRNWWHSHR